MIGGPRVEIPPRLGESKITLADINICKKVLGFQPKVSLKDWIKNNQ